MEVEEAGFRVSASDLAENQAAQRSSFCCSLPAHHPKRLGAPPRVQSSTSPGDVHELADEGGHLAQAGRGRFKRYGSEAQVLGFALSPKP